MLGTPVVNVRSGCSCSIADYHATAVVEVQMTMFLGRVEWTVLAGTEAPAQNVGGRTATAAVTVDSAPVAVSSVLPM